MAGHRLERMNCQGGGLNEAKVTPW